MALLNGQSAEEIAHEIMEKIEDRVIEIRGDGYQALEALARHENRETISLRGENWYNKNKEHLETVCLSDILVGKHKSLDKYLKEREVQKSWELFRVLVAKGVNQDEALKSVFPEGVPAPKK